jgi:hypothetical protein
VLKTQICVTRPQCVKQERTIKNKHVYCQVRLDRIINMPATSDNHHYHKQMRSVHTYKGGRENSQYRSQNSKIWRISKVTQTTVEFSCAPKGTKKVPTSLKDGETHYTRICTGFRFCLFIQLRTAALRPFRLSTPGVSTRVTTREHPAAEGGTVGEKCPGILPKFRLPHYI